MIPKIIHEDLSHSGWCIAMLEEMNTLDDNGTCDFISLPTGKKTFGCKWVFAIKVNPGGSIAHLKVHLVVKGYAQTRKYIWSNHGLLLWGRMIKFVDFANLCMG